MSGQPKSDKSKAAPEAAAENRAREGDTGAPEAGSEARKDQAPAEQAQGAEAPGPEQQIEELKMQVADLTDRLLRAHAEMDNIRKRSEKEKADVAKYAISKFAGDVVPVGDNFRRAVSALPANEGERSETLKSLLDGVLMIEREFLNALERNGVRRVDPTGEIFNPHFHQAVMEQVNPEVPAGTVVQVFQPGYVIDDRVLRPAMVVVAKGGPKPNQAAQAKGAAAPEGAPDAPAETGPESDRNAQ
jgi:molecular chaperone GrpE